MIAWADKLCNENRDLIYPYNIERTDVLQGFVEILRNEYPTSSTCILADKQKRIHSVIIFESAEDKLTFTLKYGHLYGEKNV